MTIPRFRTGSIVDDIELLSLFKHRGFVSFAAQVNHGYIDRLLV